MATPANFPPSAITGSDPTKSDRKSDPCEQLLQLCAHLGGRATALLGRLGHELQHELGEGGDTILLG